MSGVDDYFAAAGGVLARIASEQRDRITAAGHMVGEAIARGGVVHVFGSGHSHLIAEEAFFRAGGLAAVNPILDERLAFRDGAIESTRAEQRSGYARDILARETVQSSDVAVVVSNSGRNAVPVEMAMEFRKGHVAVIAITSLAHSRSAPPAHGSGLRLFDVADLTIDTCVEAGDAAVGVAGTAIRMGPLSTLAAAVIVHAMSIAAASHLVARGHPVPALPSANLPGTTEQMLREILAPYRHRVRLLRLDEDVAGP